MATFTSLRTAVTPISSSSSSGRSRWAFKVRPRGRRLLSSFSPAKAQVQPTTFAVPVVAQKQQQQQQQQQQQASIPPPPPFHLRPDVFLSGSAPTRRRLSRTYFETSAPLWTSNAGDRPPDPNKAKLGRTLRILQERLPTLLQSPLPQSILAPNISLQLFPSTHPHLPTVSGRVAYMAALRTSPIAWNRVPLIGNGNVRLEILAERMTAEPVTFLPRRAGAIPEQLVVRWREKRSGEEGPSQQQQQQEEEESRRGLSLFLKLSKGTDPEKPFTGLFIFDFDSEGRILSHTIEHVQEGGNWEKGMGAKFVGLTDWLLGGMKNPGETPMPAFERKND